MATVSAQHARATKIHIHTQRAKNSDRKKIDEAKSVSNEFARARTAHQNAQPYSCSQELFIPPQTCCPNKASKMHLNRVAHPHRPLFPWRSSTAARFQLPTARWKGTDFSHRIAKEKPARGKKRKTRNDAFWYNRFPPESWARFAHREHKREWISVCE